MSVRNEPRPLRERYTEGEREEQLKSLLPKPPNLKPEDFRKALGLSQAQFEDVESIINLAFEDSGLSEFESLKDPDAMIRLNAAALEPVRALKTILADVPEWFTLVWCTRIIEYLHQKRLKKLGKEREEIRLGKKPESVVPTGMGLSIPGAATLPNMTFELIMERNQKGSRLYVEELAASRFLEAGKPVNQSSSYSLKSFMREFEDIINQARESPLRLGHGALGYRTKAGIFKPISKQHHFEVAINDLFNNRGGAYKLKFHHREENNKERSSRIAAAAAARRLKDGQKEQSPAAQRLQDGAKKQSPAAQRLKDGPKEQSPAAPRLKNGQKEQSPAAQRLKDGPKEQSPAAGGLKVPEKAVKQGQSKSRENSASRSPATHRGRSPGPKATNWSPPPTPSPNRPLPPIPKRTATKDESVDREAARKRDGSGVRDVKGESEKVITKASQSDPRLPDRTEKPLPPLPTSSRPSSRAPGASSNLTPTSSRPTSRTRKPSPAATGPRRQPGPPLAAVKPSRDYTPPPISRASQEAWRRGNKLNPPATAGQGSRNVSPASTSSVTSSIRRGKTSRPGMHVPAAAPTSLPPSSLPSSSLPPSSQPQPSPPSAPVKPVAARRNPVIIVPRSDPVSRFSDSDDSISLSNLPRNGPKPTTPPKQRKKNTERRLKLMEEPPSTPREAVKRAVVKAIVPLGHGVISVGRRASRVLEMISPPSPSKGAPEYQTDSPRNSLFRTISRVSTGLKDTKVGLGPSTRKTLGIAKPRIFSGSKVVDKWAQQDLEFEGKGKVVAFHTYRRGGDEYMDDKADLFKDMEKEIRPGEADDLGDIREELDDDEPVATRGEYMVQQLQKMQNMPELAQMYDHDFTFPFPESPAKPAENTRWKQCCQLFQRDPESTSIDERVILAGLKTPIYLYQAFGIYWQMKTSRALGGGFVCDEMGLGKTLSFLAYMVVERQLAMLHWQVEHPGHIKNGGHTHLTAEAAASDPTLACPSASRRGPGWIPCPCASPLTAQLVPKPGVRLAVVPPSLVSTWVEQWNTHIDESNQLMMMKLIIAHDASNDKPIGGGFDLRDARHRSNHIRVQADHVVYVAADRADHTKEFFSDGARFAQERLLVLTTTEHYFKHYAKKFERTAPLWSWERKEEGEILPDQPVPGVVYGIAMIDECHEEFHKNQGRSAVLARLPRAGRPFVWGYSGTPITTTPKCLEGVLWAIENLWPKSHRRNVNHLTGLEQDRELAQFSCQRLGAIAEQFERDVKENKGSPILFRDIYLRLKPFLVMFVLRRTADTPWFGQPLIKLPPHMHKDILLEHEVEYDPKLEQWGWNVDDLVKSKLAELQNNLQDIDLRIAKEKLPTKFTFNSEMRMRFSQRIMATFPYLVQNAALLHPNHLDLTYEELKKFRGPNEKRPVNPYWVHLKGIGARSPKMMWIYHFIKELDQTKDVNGQEQKVVIMSEFNQVALVVKLWIETYIKDKAKRVGLVYAGMPPRERRSILDAFTDAKDDKGNRKQKADYQFLVGTTRIIGAGLQLTRACNVIMMEPDYEFYRELQGYARVHRVGQRNPESRSYRLLESGNQVESRILQRQAERGEFPGRPDEEEEDIHRYGDVTEIVAKYANPEEGGEGEEGAEAEGAGGAEDLETQAFMDSLPPALEVTLQEYMSKEAGRPAVDDLYSGK
ncbi:hypothetical protein LZ554_008581 [Drepanopeziza brunnea f. sp. 'monogermtubi']|nr:hypothetical protein LZ554_008581 [Drepanopeziza brunnea f. sp. 'monogermtubi']